MANPSLKNPGVWGIDLGQCALKAVRLQEVDGQLVATAFDYVEYPKILSQPDADPDQLTREALEWATTRGARSGRVAWQYVQDLAGRLGVRMTDPDWGPIS